MDIGKPTPSQQLSHGRTSYASAVPLEKANCQWRSDTTEKFTAVAASPGASAVCLRPSATRTHQSNIWSGETSNCRTKYGTVTQSKLDFRIISIFPKREYLRQHRTSVTINIVSISYPQDSNRTCRKRKRIMSSQK